MGKEKSKHHSKNQTKKKKLATNKKQLWVRNNYSKINKILIALITIGFIITAIFFTTHNYYTSLLISYISVILIVIDLLIYFLSSSKKYFDALFPLLILISITSYFYAPIIINPILNKITNETIKEDLPLETKKNKPDISNRLNETNVDAIVPSNEPTPSNYCFGNNPVPLKNTLLFYLLQVVQ